MITILAVIIIATLTGLLFLERRRSETFESQSVSAIAKREIEKAVGLQFTVTEKINFKTKWVRLSVTTSPDDSTKPIPIAHLDFTTEETGIMLRMLWWQNKSTVSTVGVLDPWKLSEGINRAIKAAKEFNPPPSSA